MTLFTNTAAGGAAGTAATLTNTGGGSGDAFLFSDQTGTGTSIWEFSSTAAHGSLGYRIVGNGSRAFFGWNGRNTTTMSWRTYIRMTNRPAAEMQIATVRNATTYAGGLNLTPTGTLKVTKTGGAPIYTGATVLALNTWYRIEMAWSPGTSTTTGRVWYSLFQGDSTTAVENFSAVNTDLGVAALTGIQMGKHTTANDWEAYFDSIAMDDATTTLLGPLATPVASVRPGSTPFNDGNWSSVGGSGGTFQAAADELDSTYVTTGATPSNAEIIYGMNGTLNAGPVTVKVRASIDTAVAGTLVVSLMQGSSTAIASRTFNLTTTITDYSFTTTSAETNLISNRSDLRIRLVANQT